ncbi:UNVERIFIED_CONTAM: hypothetical protein Slati_1306300 [Sesamum latifolium]|uniref:Uncharacterized protein n=1 Tax=Sesamum latifolium TaxID=2727402 RepID=A0AAW2XGJ0_9LAMI
MEGDKTHLTNSRTPVGRPLMSKLLTTKRSPHLMSRRTLPPGAPPQEPTIQLTQKALLALIHDASTRAVAQAVAQFAANRPVNLPPHSPRRSRELSSASEEEEQWHEKVNSRVSRLEVAQEQNPPSPPPPGRGKPPAPRRPGGARIFICY